MIDIYQRDVDVKSFCQHSGKLPVLSKIVTDILTKSHKKDKIAIASQFVKVLDVVEIFCLEESYTFMR